MGLPFIVVTCPDCLRSFPLSVVHENLQHVQETPCLFCPTTVKYVVDFSREVISPPKKTAQSHKKKTASSSPEVSAARSTDTKAS